MTTDNTLRGGSVGCRIPKAAATVVFREIERHVGHSLCCNRTLQVVAGYVVETVAMRCEECGEIILEGTNRVRQRRTP